MCLRDAEPHSKVRRAGGRGPSSSPRQTRHPNASGQTPGGRRRHLFPPLHLPASRLSSPAVFTTKKNIPGASGRSSQQMTWSPPQVLLVTGQGAPAKETLPGHLL